MPEASAVLAPRPPLHLVDASLYVFRAWHSMPDQFHDADGWPTNAVHGFARFLLELLEQERPTHITIAFDEALDSCFRNKLYPAYKANRDPAPRAQAPVHPLQGAVRGLGIERAGPRRIRSRRPDRSALHSARPAASAG